MSDRLPRALLEREPHLELIDVVLQQTADGNGQVLWIEGPAGAGKTSLVRAAAAEAAAAGMTVLQATAEELETDHVLGVVHQLFDPLVRRCSPSGREQLFAGPARAARTALLGPAPDLPRLDATDTAGTTHATGANEADEHDGPDTVAAHLRSGAVHHGLYWLVAQLSDERPVVLTVDDLHWADDTSLAFLAYLARRVTDLPVALVLGTRPVLDGLSRDPRARIRSLPHAHHLRPPALSRQAVATLVRAQSPAATDEQCRAVFDASGGNPFLVEVAAGMADASADRLHGEVRRRLAALDPDVQHVAKAVAILGVERTVVTVGAVAAMPLATTLDAVAVLRDQDWIEVERSADEPGTGPVAPGDTLRFRHPLVRDAVVQLSRAPEIDALHAHAIDALIDGGADPGEIAIHALASGPRGSGPTAHALLVAAHEARRSGAPRHAVRLLERALAEPPAPEDRQRVLELLARVATVVDAPGADAHLAAALAGMDDVRDRNHLRQRVAAALIATQRSGLAARLMEEALAEQDDDPASRIELLATRLVALRVDPNRRREWERDLDELLAWGIDVGTEPDGDDPGRRTVAIDPRSPAVRAARAELAYREGVTGGSYERARRLAIEAVGDADGHTLAVANGHAFSTAMHALLQVGELQLVADVTARAMHDAQVAGYGSVFRLASTYHAVSLVRTGHARAAIADAVIDEVLERHLTVLVPVNAVVTAQAYLMLGLLDDAERALEPPGGSARFRTELTYGGIPEWRGWLRLAQGRPVEAAEAFLELSDNTSTLGGANPSTNTWRSGAARALLLTGDRRRARQLSDTELELARAWGGWRQLGLALTTAGIVRSGAAAAAALDEAVAQLEQGPDPYSLGWAYLHRGLQRRAARQRAEAREDLRRALDLGQRHELALLADAANDALVEAGGRPRTRVLSGVDALTPAELRVARAVAAGQSNAEVAASLFITRKAVEYHLSNVYRKLAIRGRGELPAALS